MKNADLLSVLSSAEHYAVINSFAIDVEIVEHTISYNGCTKDFKQIPTGYHMTHNRVNYSGYDNDTP